MEIILLEDVDTLGDRGERVQVKAGYARNYLIPRGLALRATRSNLAQWGHIQRLIDKRESKNRKAAEDLKTKIEGLQLTFPARAGEDDRLFGSVTNQDIARLLAEQGIEVDRRKVLLQEPIRKLDVYHVPVKLHRDVQAEVKLFVVRSEGPAEVPAESTPGE